MNRNLLSVILVQLVFLGCNNLGNENIEGEGSQDTMTSDPPSSNISSVGLVEGSSDGTKPTYFPPGDILPKSVRGIERRIVEFPNWVFPMPVGVETGIHAYIGTQLPEYHGQQWNNDPILYRYPHRDNQCEPRARGFANALCPQRVGHQGVDIRPHDNRKNTWEVVSVNSGVVTLVTDFSTVSIRSGTTTVQYLHMDKASISEFGIEEGVLVEKGQTIGRVSCIMSGSCTTSIHLHLHAYDGSLGRGHMYHVYPSLISAYLQAWQYGTGVEEGELTNHADLEITGN